MKSESHEVWTSARLVFSLRGPGTLAIPTLADRRQ